MVVPNGKSHAEYYRDRLLSRSDANTTRDLTAGTPGIICPSGTIREAIYYHDLGLIEKLKFRLSSWFRKRTD